MKLIKFICESTVPETVDIQYILDESEIREVFFSF